MEPEQFYGNLRSDRERVQTFVDELKAGGFEVYATGSALKHSDYNDVDLVVKPGKGMTSGDIRNQLEIAIESIEGQEASNAEEQIRRTEIDFEFMNGVEDLLDLKRSLTYVESEITKRYHSNIGGTKIDISVAYDPFALKPGTDYIKL